MTGLISSVATCVERAARPLSTVSVVIVGDVYRLVVRYAGMMRADADTLRTPGGKVAMAHHHNPFDALDIAPVSDRDIVAAAWAHGAWDVIRTTIAPGYEGSLPEIAPDEQPQIAVMGGVSRDTPAGLTSLAAEARKRGYTTWAWRPMLYGPEMRIKAFAHRDSTLDPLTLTRGGPPPHVRIRPAKPGSQLEITLGRKH